VHKSVRKPIPRVPSAPPLAGAGGRYDWATYPAPRRGVDSPCTPRPIGRSIGPVLSRRRAPPASTPPVPGRHSEQRPLAPRCWSNNSKAGGVGCVPTWPRSLPTAALKPGPSRPLERKPGLTLPSRYPQPPKVKKSRARESSAKTVDAATTITCYKPGLTTTRIIVSARLRAVLTVR